MEKSDENFWVEEDYEMYKCSPEYSEKTRKEATLSDQEEKKKRAIEEDCLKFINYLTAKDG